jgi:protein Tex
VHVSQLADRFVKDPRDVVKAGQIVKVKVVEVDLKRKRIALTMKLGEAGQPVARPPRPAASRPTKPASVPPRAPETSIAAAFSRLQSNSKR